MPKFKPHYTRDGIDFVVIARQGNICLLDGKYRNADNHTYEVHILRMKKAHPKSANAGEMILSSPSESEWGKYGFTYMTKERTYAKFEKLVALSDEMLDSLDRGQHRRV